MQNIGIVDIMMLECFDIYRAVSLISSFLIGNQFCSRLRLIINRYYKANSFETKSGHLEFHTIPTPNFGNKVNQVSTSSAYHCSTKSGHQMSKRANSILKGPSKSWSISKKVSTNLYRETSKCGQLSTNMFIIS